MLNGFFFIPLKRNSCFPCSPREPVVTRERDVPVVRRNSYPCRGDYRVVHVTEFRDKLQTSRQELKVRNMSPGGQPLRVLPPPPSAPKPLVNGASCAQTAATLSNEQNKAYPVKVINILSRQLGKVDTVSKRSVSDRLKDSYRSVNDHLTESYRSVSDHLTESYRSVNDRLPVTYRRRSLYGQLTKGSNVGLFPDCCLSVAGN